MTSLTRLAGLAAVLVGSIAIAARGSRSSAPTLAVSSDPDAVEADEPSPAVDRLSRVTPFPVSETSQPRPAVLREDLQPGRFATSKDMLMAYWGDRWDLVADEILADSAWLEQIDPRTLRPWPEVRRELEEDLIDAYSTNIEDVVEKIATWGYDPDSIDFQHERFGLATPALGQSQLTDLHAIVRGYDAPLRNLAVQYQSALLHTVVTALATNQFEAHPLIYPHASLETPRLRARDLLALEVLNYDGWCVVLQLPRSEYPEFESWIADAERLRELRMTAVREYLAAL